VPGALAEAVVGLGRDAALRDRLGAEARATIERRRLTWDGVAERIEQVVQECLAERAATGDRRGTG
jgi:glycosyltransferase involved in cell wall biosynthesis